MTQAELDTLTEKIMREERVSWHQARAIMGQRGAAARARKHTPPVKKDADFEAWKARMEAMGRF